MDQQRQLELYALPDRQPMELTKYWRYVLQQETPDFIGPDL